MNTTTTAIVCSERHHGRSPAAKSYTMKFRHGAEVPAPLCGVHAAAILRSWRGKSGYDVVHPLTDEVRRGIEFRHAFLRAIADIEQALSAAARDVARSAKVEAIWAERRNEAPVATLGDFEPGWDGAVREVTVYVHEAGMRFDNWNAVKVTLKVSEDEPAVVEVRGAMWPKAAVAVAEVITYLSAMAEELDGAA